MNTVLIISDSFRKDHLGCYGNGWIHTPSLDRFASQSVTFDQAYTGSYATVPSRGDVHTGMYVFPRYGWEPLTYTDVTLSKTLGDAGFVTQMYVDTPHIIKDGFHFDKGFTAYEWIRGQESDRFRHDPTVDVPIPCAPEKLRSPYTVYRQHYQNIAHWQSEEDRFCAQTLSKGAEWIEQHRKLDRWFLCLDTFDPHEPYDAPESLVELYDPGYDGEVITYPAYGPASVFSKREIRNIRARYAAECSLVDKYVGKVLRKIEDCGLGDEVMVIFTTDHGFMLGEHNIMGKGNSPFYLELAAVPFIARAPGARPGSRSRAFVQMPDLMPTILEAGGVAVPETVQGKSFLPVLTGKSRSKLRPQAITSWPLTTNPDAHTLSLITNDEWALFYRGVGGKHELFHIKRDPGQKKNLFRVQREVAAAMHKGYVKFLKEHECPEDCLALRTAF